MDLSSIGIKEGAPATPEEKAERQSGWKSFFERVANDQQLNAVMMAMGGQLAGPQNPNLNTAQQVSQALTVGDAAGQRTANRLFQQGIQQEEIAQRDRLQERRIESTEGIAEENRAADKDLLSMRNLFTGKENQADRTQQREMVGIQQGGANARAGLAARTQIQVANLGIQKMMAQEKAADARLDKQLKAQMDRLDKDLEVRGNYNEGRIEADNRRVDLLEADLLNKANLDKSSMSRDDAVKMREVVQMAMLMSTDGLGQVDLEKFRKNASMLNEGLGGKKGIFEPVRLSERVQIIATKAAAAKARGESLPATPLIVNMLNEMYDNVPDDIGEIYEAAVEAAPTPEVSSRSRTQVEPENLPATFDEYTASRESAAAEEKKVEEEKAAVQLEEASKRELVVKALNPNTSLQDVDKGLAAARELYEQYVKEGANSSAKAMADYGVILSEWRKIKAVR